jgi:parallel beta-helix repeat protein
MKDTGWIVLCLALIFSALLPISTVRSETYISNDIWGSETWTLEGSPYILTDNISIMDGATLTIEPGVEVRFEEAMGLDISGTLITQGTGDQPILFTSNSSAPDLADWQGLFFHNSPGNPTSLMSHTIIEYAEKGVEIESGNPIYNLPPHITMTTFRNCTYGMYLDIEGSFEHLNFENCENTISGSYFILEVSNSTFKNCGFETSGIISVVFENNTLIADPEYWTGVSASGYKVFIANNTVFGGYGGGLGGSEGNITIINNIIVNGSIGISDAKGLIANNSITNAWRGINLHQSNGVLVENNRIENITWAGIELGWTDESTISNNVITNGTRDPGSPLVVGIYLGSSDYNVLDSNKITHFTEGIFVGQCEGTVINNTVITDIYQDLKTEGALFEGRGNAIVLSINENATILNTVIDGAVTGVNHNTGEATIENITILNCVEGIRGRFGEMWISNSSISTSQYDFYLGYIKALDGGHTVWAENVLFDEEKVYFDDDSSAIHLSDKTLTKEDEEENGNGDQEQQPLLSFIHIGAIVLILLIIIVSIIIWKKRR